MDKVEAVDMSDNAMAEAQNSAGGEKKPRYRIRPPYKTKKRMLQGVDVDELRNSRSNSQIQPEKKHNTDRDYTKKPLNFKYITNNVVNSIDDHYSLKYDSNEITTEEKELKELSEAVSESVNELLDVLKININPVWFIIIQITLLLGSFVVKKWFQILKAKNKFMSRMGSKDKVSDAAA